MGPLALVLLGFVLAAPGEAETPEAPPPRIREIVILRDPVSMDWSSSWGQTINRFHVLTKEQVIRRELLFEEGDVLDQDLVDETENRLRDLRVFRKVRIWTEPAEEGLVDVVVRTRDHWSTVPGYILESGGGLTQAGVELVESNLFGLGKTIAVEGVYETDVGTTWGVDYWDPQLFGSRWVGSAGYATGPLIEAADFSLARPLASPDDKWSYGFGGFLADATIRLFDQGEEVSRHSEESDGAWAYVVRAFGERFAKKKLGLSYYYNERLFGALGDQTTQPFPEDEIVSSTAVTFSFGRVKNREETHINSFERTENVPLGSETLISVGRAGFPVRVGVERWEIFLTHFADFRLGRARYLQLTGNASTLEVKNKLLGLRARYYDRVRPDVTLAAHVDVDYGRDLEEGQQFILGGDSGLRGYPARQFTGNKRFRANLEARYFTRIKVLTTAVGLVAFMDAGNAWDVGVDMDLGQLKYSVGVGLRLGAVGVAGEPVTRIDFGYPLNGDGQLRLVFGIGQQF